MKNLFVKLKALKIRDAVKSFYQDPPPSLVYAGKVLLGLIALLLVACLWLGSWVIPFVSWLHSWGDRLIKSVKVAIGEPEHE